jgi:FixJ family two-component response regulator
MLAAGKRQEFEFAEIPVDRLILESFANERSAYHSEGGEGHVQPDISKIRSRLKWHIVHSLSVRQRQVIQGVLSGKKEREIAQLLGVTQQVVHIYKHRAIKRLHKILAG